LATHPSALKRHRQSLKRRARNQQTESKIKNLLKKARTAAEAKDQQTSQSSLKEINQALDKAVNKGVLKRNTASRKLSRVARAIHRSLSGA